MFEVIHIASIHFKPEFTKSKKKIKMAMIPFKLEVFRNMGLPHKSKVH